MRFCFAWLCLVTSFWAFSADGVVVYSSRNEHLIKPLFEAFTEETGIEVTYHTDKEGPLLQRLQAEGRRTRADVLLTVDAGNLWKAADMGLLQPVESKVLEQNIPGHLQDPENRWFGFSVRARTIVYHTERVTPGELRSYAGLAGQQWKDRLVLRTSKKVYNQSLVAMMLAEYGEEETLQILKGWVENLAAPVFSNDTKLMEGILAGQGDVGIVNTYYFGRLKKDNPDMKLALFWPDQNASGVHVNISGAGMTKHAPHPEAAKKLLEWFSSEKAQHLFADLNLEYPANPKIEPDPLVASWGTFKQNLLNVSFAGSKQADAIVLMDRAGYK